MHIRSLALKENTAGMIKEVLKAGLFVFFLSAASHIRVYLPYSPVPVTFQTLAVFLSVVFLARGAVSVLLFYLILGIVGLPVFSQGAGFLYLAGPTGGYIMGFFLAALALIKMLPLKKGLAWYILSFLLADSIILISGSLWLSLIMQLSLARAVAIGVLPFIYGDMLKVTLAALIARLASFRCAE